MWLINNSTYVGGRTMKKEKEYADAKEVNEANVKKAVQKAFKQLLKEIENEPKLVIESNLDNTLEDSAQMENVLDWLFRRKEVENDD
jgi:uncharacterized protein YlxW (UPF0749 family)